MLSDERLKEIITLPYPLYFLTTHEGINMASELLTLRAEVERLKVEVERLRGAWMLG